MCFGIRWRVALPCERHLVLQVGVVIRAVAVAAFKEYDGENGADEEDSAENANEDEEPWLVDAQVGVAWKLDVFNMVGVEAPQGGLAHESSEAGLRVIISRQNKFRALRQQK